MAKSFLKAAVYVLAFAASLLLPAQAQGIPVNLTRTPNGGIQPDAAVDAKGVTHLIYFIGDPMHGDLFYVTWPSGKNAPPSKPIKVNSIAGGAVAMGTIRPAQLALDDSGMPHIVWNASGNAPKTANGHIPLFYTHLDKTRTKFEPERDLIAGAQMLDGGSSVAANGKNVYVTWHAVGKGSDEAHAGVYISTSIDGGGKFAAERQIGPALGACGCCSMKAFADKSGAVYVLYRTAKNNTDRHCELLVSRDRGKTFASKDLDAWEVNACPMTTFSIASGPAGIIGGWQNKGQIKVAAISKNGPAFQFPAPATEPRKYPSVSCDKEGNTLAVWTTGAGWGRGGALVWQVFDKNGKPRAEHGGSPGVPTWSFTAAVPNQGNGFTIIY
jgi:hypothetical protein